ncbi:MAG: DNA-directed DNA polymerase [Candidatus Micrarchaeota archaeon]
MKRFRATIIEADYTTKNGKALIRLLLKHKRFLRVYDDSFEPYFYFWAEDLERAKKKLEALSIQNKDETVTIKRIEKIRKKLRSKETEVLKVYCHHPSHVPLLRPHLWELGTPYEHDIRFARRYFIDKGLTPFNILELECEGKFIRSIRDTGESNTNLRTLAFDIETYNPAGAPREKKDPAIMISYAGESEGVITYRKTGRSFSKDMGSEKEMIAEFLRVIRKNDVEMLLGYNSTSFDLPYLKQRADACGLNLGLGRDGSTFRTRRRGMFNEVKVTGRLHLDLYPIVRFLGTIGALKIYKFTLQNAYEEIVGKKKLMVDKLGIWEMWDNESEIGKLADYSLEDARTTYAVGERIIPMEIELSRIVHIPLFEIAGTSTGNLVELLLFLSSYERDIIVPNRPREELVKERATSMLKGAYVKLPNPGAYDNLAVFDFRGLYPSIICSYNIDPDMIDCDCCTKEEAHISPSGSHFCSKRKGLIPEVLNNLVSHRSSIKKELKQLPRDSKEYVTLNARQQALKVLSNSFYGMLAYPRSRWYSLECGEAVTSLGRHYIQETAKEAEKEGFEVLYGDTDSIFLLLGKKKRHQALEFMKKVNKDLPGNMELELEGFYPRGLFVTKKVQGKKEGLGAKKKYALIGEDGRIKIRGFELVRRDWSPISKKTQQAVLEAILKEGSKEKAVSIVKSTITNLREGKVAMEDLVITNQIKRRFEAYEVISPEMVVAEKLREKGHPADVGSVVEYVITKNARISDQLRKKIENKRMQMRMKRNTKARVGAKGSEPISYKAEPIDFAKDYDADYYINNQILPAVLKILKELGYGEDDLKFKGTQSSLGEF